jgi:cysteine desulfurase/selenocysteine lyase
LAIDTLVHKKDFPIFSDDSLVYLDSASTSQKPSDVINGLKNVYEHSNANVHRALYNLGSESTQMFESAREKISSFINASSSQEIVFTGGTTESINLLAYTLGTKLEEHDEILISHMEHHANLVPWQLLAKRSGAKLRYLPLTESGELDLSQSEKYFTNKTKIISITHMSNVLGTVNPIKKIAKIAKSIGAVFVVDGAQSVSHMPVDVQNLGCDFLAFSGHKMLGPTGIGVLWGTLDNLKSLPPFMTGGEMIETVTLDSSTWNKVPYKFEAGTPNYVQAIGLGIAVEYLNKIGMKKIQEHEKKLTDYAIKKLERISGLYIHGNPSNRGGVISFNLNKIHPQDLAQFLNEDNICIRVGHHCAQPLLKTLDETSTARISFYVYNDSSEVDKLVESIQSTIKYF